MPNARSFFRPPYGAFTSLGAANISRVNDAGADKYTAPVFWTLAASSPIVTPADWACWGKVSIDRCMDGYIAETRARGKGIILVHDVYSKTADMLMDTGGANGRSLIKRASPPGLQVRLRGAATPRREHAGLEKSHCSRAAYSRRVQPL